jgi:pimeloyl-ACP methyl ester carboxylesterase
LQGLALSSRFWFRMPELLTQAGYRVVTPDNRGTGRSDKPRGPYTMRRFARDVVAVLDHAGLERAVVAGISMGGMIAQELALRHPERVLGLVLLATSPGLPHGKLASPRTLLTLLSLPFRRDGRALARLLLPRTHHPRARELLAEWPAAMAAEPVPFSTFWSHLAAATTHSTGSRLARLRCDTVVIHGADDMLIHPDNGRFLARRIPGAILEVLPDVGHGIPIVDERAIARALGRLVARSTPENRARP